MTLSHALIGQFKHSRGSPVSLLLTAQRALSRYLGPEEAAKAMATPTGRSIENLSKAIDEQPPRGPIPPYHNIEHFKEAVTAMAMLTSSEFAGNPERSKMACLGVLAMIAHDFMHDGTINSAEKSLEAIAWEASLPHIQTGGMAPPDMAIIRDIVMGTDPKLLGANRDRYFGSLPEGALGRGADRLRLLANEADTAGSLLPGHGHKLGDLLAAEWRQAGLAGAQTVSNWASRLGFLRHVATGTSGAQSTGLEQARVDQIEAFERIANDMALPDAASAAQRLDQIAASDGKPQALAVYAKALARVAPALAKAAFPEELSLARAGRFDIAEHVDLPRVPLANIKKKLAELRSYEAAAPLAQRSVAPKSS